MRKYSILRFLSCAVLCFSIVISPMMLTAVEAVENVYSPCDSLWGQQNNNGWYWLLKDKQSGNYCVQNYGTIISDQFANSYDYDYHRVSKTDAMIPAGAELVFAFKAPVGGRAAFSFNAVAAPESEEHRGRVTMSVTRNGVEGLNIDGYGSSLIQLENDNLLRSYTFTADLAAGDAVYIAFSCDYRHYLWLGSSFPGMSAEYISYYTSGATGDVNDDGRTDIRDLVRYKKHLARTAWANPCNADINSDYCVSSQDMVELKRILNGVPTDKIAVDTIRGTVSFPTGNISIAFDNADFAGTGLINASKDFTSNKDQRGFTFPIGVGECAYLQKLPGNTGNVGTSFTGSADGTVAITQKATVTSGGISGLCFGFTVSQKYEIILPVNNGVALSSENPELWYGNSSVNYPDEWNMQMLLIQGDNGGLLLYADDDGTQFKRLNLSSDSESYYISVETIPQAPFTQYQSFETVEWRLVPYKGNWTQGAALYRSFADEKFGLSEANESKPDWARDMQVFVLSDLDNLSMLDELAKEVDPKKTLLQYPAWRLNPYDVNYPDYTAAADAKQIIDYAHSLGFRVQLHINMNACQDDMSEYARFKDVATLDAYTGEVYYFTTSDSNRSYKFTQMNPASAEWRSFMIDTLKRVVAETGADALHLDQSLLCYNDGRGLLDGLTSMQGNVLYHKELAEALPGVAIGSEGVTDINVRYTSFAQSAPYGIDWSKREADQKMLDQITPVTMAVYDSYVSVYQWPGEPTTLDEEYWQCWYRACNMLCGYKPTIMRCSTAELSSPNALMRLFLNEANWYCEYNPQNLYTGWTDGTMMRYILSDGTTAEYRKTDFGDVLLGNVNDSDSVVSGFITGVSSLSLPGTVADWFYYNSEQVLGLDSTKTYIYYSQPRAMTNTHIESLPENVTLDMCKETASYTAISLKKTVDGGLGNTTVVYNIVTKKNVTAIMSGTGGLVRYTETGDCSYRVNTCTGETVYFYY